MRRTPSKFKTLADENPFGLSLGDLMAGLLLIFVLLLSFLMLNLTEKEESLREKEKRLLEIVETYVKLREDLYLDLKREFEKDLKKWKAVLDREKISVRFREPKVLFAQGETDVQLAFKEILDKAKIKGLRMYNNPLYLDFLRGAREYQCTAYSNPTYTVMGWRKPCYPLADEHVQDVNELFEDSVWAKYGVGKDPRCAGCMMHCGFESATIFNAISSPRDWVTLVKSGAASKGGLTAG